MKKVQFNVDGAIRELCMRAKALSNTHAICELIDNSLDAGASSVRISISGDKMAIADDGMGCPPISSPGKNLSSGMLDLYESKPTTKKQTGRWGQGLKMASACLGGRVAISTMSESGGFNADVNWSDGGLLREKFLHPSRGAKTGTRIGVKLHVKWKQERIDKLSNELSWIYRTAMLGGRVISMNGRRFSPSPLPAMTEIRRLNIEFGDGRSAFIMAGLLAQEEKEHAPGIELFYRIRQIRKMNPPDGTGSFFAIVTLNDAVESEPHGDGAWCLNGNKTDIACKDQMRELQSAINKGLADLIKKDRMSEEFLPGLEFRATARASGSSTSAIGPDRRTVIGRCPETGGTSKRKGIGTKIVYSEIQSEPDTFGYARDTDVLLNTSNRLVSAIKGMKKSKERDLLIGTVLCQVMGVDYGMSLVEETDGLAPAEFVIKQASEDMSKRLSKWISTLRLPQ